MFNVGPWELIIVLVIVLLLFGPGKLPEVGKFLGKGIKEFKRAVNSIETDIAQEPAQVKKAVPPSDDPAGDSPREK